MQRKQTWPQHPLCPVLHVSQFSHQPLHFVLPMAFSWVSYLYDCFWSHILNLCIHATCLWTSAVYSLVTISFFLLLQFFWPFCRRNVHQSNWVACKLALLLTYFHRVDLASYRLSHYLSSRLILFNLPRRISIFYLYYIDRQMVLEACLMQVVSLPELMVDILFNWTRLISLSYVFYIDIDRQTILWARHSSYFYILWWAPSSGVYMIHLSGSQWLP